MFVVTSSLARAARPVAAVYASDSAYTAGLLLLVGLVGCLLGVAIRGLA
jgi:hypothetical protein